MERSGGIEWKGMEWNIEWANAPGAADPLSRRFCRVLRVLRVLGVWRVLGV